jgi:hypothetical protein
MSEPSDATHQDARAHEVRRQELWSKVAFAAIGKTVDPASVANAALNAFDETFGPDPAARRTAVRLVSSRNETDLPSRCTPIGGPKPYGLRAATPRMGSPGNFFKRDEVFPGN